MSAFCGDEVAAVVLPFAGTPGMAGVVEAMVYMRPLTGGAIGGTCWFDFF